MSTPTYASTTVRSGLVERTTSLCLITVVAFVSNLLLLVTIGHSAALRSKHFNRHIVNIALINLSTCILCLPMVIGYTATNEWDYGDTMCRVLAHLFLTLSIAMCLSILALNVDRVIAVTNPDDYEKRVTSGTTAFIIILAWLVAILFPLPLSLDVVATAPFQDRYMCSITSNNTISYLIPLYTTCFALPSLINIFIFVHIAREALSEKEKESLSGPHLTNKLWPEVKAAGVVFVIFLLWVFFELPYFTLTSIQQYIYSREVNGEFSYSADLDTAFMWLKFCDCCLLPFVVFWWRKDIWYKFKDLMFCRKRNSVLDASPRQEKSYSTNSNSKMKQAKSLVGSGGDTPKFEASFPIPTIKASKDGLHVHGNADDDGEFFYADMDLTGRTADFDGTRTTATIEHHEEKPHDIEDTSDYETDPYSQSDPISVRSAVSSERIPTHHRSQPLPTSHNKEFRTKANSVSHDSGNGSASSSVKKKRRKARGAAELYIEADATSNDTMSQNATEEIIKPSTRRADTTSSDDVGQVLSRLEPAELVSSPPNTQQRKKKSKRDQPTTEDSAVTVSAGHDTIEVLDSEEVRPVAKKKKKKKKRQANASADAETNTSQVMSLEMVERRLPPPRLAPINHSAVHSAISGMATPPLRSKFPTEPHTDILPPASEKKRKRRSADQTDEGAESTKSERRRRKSSRPRNQSGDSDKALMGSNTSSELHAIDNESYHESHT